MTRMVRILDENVQAEVVSEQLCGAYVRYYRDGFEQVEFLSAEDYEYMEDDE